MLMFEEALLRVLKSLEDGEKIKPLDREQLRQHAHNIGNNSMVVSTWQNTDKSIKDAYIHFPFVPIYSKVFEQDTASLTISIPAVYKHLVIFGAGRTNGAAGGRDFLFVQFNGDTSASYGQEKWLGSAGNVIVQNVTSQTVAIVGLLSQGGSAAGANGSFFALLPHYNSDYFKHLRAWMMGVQFLIYSEWGNVSHITSLTFTPAADSIAAGSAISVYGLF